MRIGGVIAEYNPFHSGHEYQLSCMRDSGISHIAVVMSGNYVQRGEPAIYSKWVRARAAIEGGADLVVELPTPNAMAPASDFALAGVASLYRLGVHELWFGSECGSLDSLQKTAECCIFAEQSDALKSRIASGLGFPKARELAVSELFGEEFIPILRAPNNMLGIEYLRANQLFGNKLQLITHLRKEVQHDKLPSDRFASASWIRQEIWKGNFETVSRFLPVRAARLYRAENLAQSGPVDLKKLDLLILNTLRQMDSDQISKIRDVSEGLENRILRESSSCRSFEECVNKISGKRYTKARIRRILLNAFLGINDNTFPKIPQYLRILAMNERGMEILKNAKGPDQFPVKSKFADLVRMNFTEIPFEIQATDLYSLLQPSPQPCGREFTEQVAILRRN